MAPDSPLGSVAQSAGPLIVHQRPHPFRLAALPHDRWQCWLLVGVVKLGVRMGGGEASIQGS